METAAKTVLLMGLLPWVLAAELVMNCKDHCRTCGVQRALNCVNNSVLLLDGDVCKCCDVCGFTRGFHEDCRDTAAMNIQHGKVLGKVLPAKCLFGYECVSGVCEHAEGFCSTWIRGRPQVYSCDLNGNYLPVECSDYHCWCVDPFTGSPLSSTKVPNPMDSDYLSYCYYLMTVRGTLDIIIPGSRQSSEVYYKKFENEAHLENIFPAKIITGHGRRKIESEISKIINERNNSPVESEVATTIDEYDRSQNRKIESKNPLETDETDEYERSQDRKIPIKNNGYNWGSDLKTESNLQIKTDKYMIPDLKSESKVPTETLEYERSPDNKSLSEVLAKNNEYNINLDHKTETKILTKTEEYNRSPDRKTESKFPTKSDEHNRKLDRKFKAYYWSANRKNESKFRTETDENNRNPHRKTGSKFRTVTDEFNRNPHRKTGSKFLSKLTEYNRSAGPKTEKVPSKIEEYGEVLNKINEDNRSPVNTVVNHIRKVLVPEDVTEGITESNAEDVTEDVTEAVTEGEEPVAQYKLKIESKNSNTGRRLRELKPLHIIALNQIKNQELEKAKESLKQLTNNKTSGVIKECTGPGCFRNRWTRLVYEQINYWERNPPQNTSDIQFGKNNHNESWDFISNHQDNTTQTLSHDLKQFLWNLNSNATSPRSENISLDWIHDAVHNYRLIMHLLKYNTTKEREYLKDMRSAILRGEPLTRGQVKKLKAILSDHIIQDHKDPEEVMYNRTTLTDYMMNDLSEDIISEHTLNGTSMDIDRDSTDKKILIENANRKKIANKRVHVSLSYPNRTSNLFRSKEPLLQINVNMGVNDYPAFRNCQKQSQLLRNKLKSNSRDSLQTSEDIVLNIDE